MNCRKHKQLLSAYMDDRLDDEKRAAIEACEGCQRTLHLMQKASAALASEGAARPPADLAARAARAALEAKDEARPASLLDGWFSVAWPTAAVTAVATVLLLIFSARAPARSPDIGIAEATDPLGILVTDDRESDDVATSVLALEDEQ